MESQPLPAIVFASVFAICLAYVASTKRATVAMIAQPPPQQVNFQEYFEVVVSPADKFKFNAAHFIAFQGFRERLHGHNYNVSVKLIGKSIQSDGYLMDYGLVKEICGRICKDELNEKFLLPMLSDVLDIKFNGPNVELFCRVDGSEFVIPRGDCAELPVVHSSTEELAVYVWERIIQEFTLQALQQRGIYAMEISVAEMPHQHAVFRRTIADYHGRLPTPPPPIKGCL